MAQGRGRTWAKRVAVGVVLVLAAAGGYAALNWTSLNAYYTGYKFRTAATADERAQWAVKLLAQGQVQPLTEPFRSGDAATCGEIVAVVRKHLAEVPPSDPRFAACCQPFLDGCGAFSDAGKLAVLDLVPDLLKAPDPETANRCRTAVRAGLTSPSPEGKVRAVRLALRSELALKAEVVPLLGDPAAPVRRAAMLAVGTLSEGGAALVSDDALFRFLHDPDSEVRDLCEAALMAREFEHEQIQLARMLTDANPAERLALARALERPDVANGKPAPWLERLAHDPEPSVRVAAARVAAERFLPNAAWLNRLAEADPDPTVRKLAGYYRGLSSPIRPAGFKSDR